MTMGRWARLALIALPLIAGCKDFWQNPYTNSGGGGGTGTTTESSGIFYVMNVLTSQIAGYYVNAGTITAVPGSPFPLLAPPFAITVAPNNNFLYVSTTNGIYLYTIASNGQLALGNAQNPISSDQAASMRVDATNSWLVDTISGQPFVYAIPINPSTGMVTSVTEQSAILPASTIQQMTLSPDNTEAFVAMGTGGTAIIPFKAANTNPLGAVSNIAVKNAGGAALSVAVDPYERLFYIGETVAVSGSNSGGLRAFNFGTLKELTGSPYPSAGLAPYSILPISTGDYVYVANRQTSSGSTGVIGGFSLSTSNSAYALTALGKAFNAGTHTVALAEDNTGNFVFAVNYDGNPDLMGYVFDTTNPGYLDPVISTTTGTDPVQASGIAAAH
ncbi:MAG: beta-propeller fold lactonase family protein [Acidobacteriota bacterium]|nr:beta-propeller fold lactonase family protein [Acidobacteriota bacterium]